MLIAEIRRKLSSLDELDFDDPESLEQLRGLLRETKEDLLTADVFGALKYLPRRPYLVTVLEALRSPNSEGEFQQALPQLRANVAELAFQFWPSYPTPFKIASGSTEPDVQLSSDRFFFLFEAKLHSPFGDRQLERELAVAAKQARNREFFLVLVTPGGRPPRFRFGEKRFEAAEYLKTLGQSDELTSAARKLLDKHRRRVLWISWESIMTSLNQAHLTHVSQAGAKSESVARARELLDDLKALMRLRRMRAFEGLAHAVKNSPSPSASGGPVFFAGMEAAMKRNRPSYDLVRALRFEPSQLSWRISEG